VPLHTQFADRRLEEARAVPGQAGAMLAEFNREATAALAAADASVALGADRRALAVPLLSWFRSARVRLVEGHPVLPPMAWRAALALVDEAIRALSSDGAFSAAAVPRMADYRQLLAARGGQRATRADLRRARRTAWEAAEAATAASPSAKAAAFGRSATPSQDAPAQVADATVAGTSERPSSATDPIRPPAEPTSPAQPTAPRHTRPTAAPSEPPATAPAPPTLEPTVAPVDPTVPPTAAPPTATCTLEPTATPTVAVIDKPPTILDVYCDSTVIDLFGSTECHVVAVDPEGKDLFYLWMADAPQMVNERQKDAVYYAAWGIGGGKMRVGIVVYVSDHEPFGVDEPNVSRAETFVEVRSLDVSEP
jgi:hypothetical protein